MNYIINDIEYSLEYSYNSIKYMGDLNFSELEQLEQFPLKIVGVFEILLSGALNHNAKNKFSNNGVSEIAEAVVLDGNLTDLFDKLMVELENSEFFKSLQ